MAAGTYDIVVDQGSDFSIEIAISQNDSVVALATHAARAQLRPSPTSSTKTAEFIKLTNGSNLCWKILL
jgi:hypothetical protein